MSTATVCDFKTCLQRAPVNSVAPENRFPRWAFEYPVAPDYMSGYASGEAAALAFMKYIQGGRIPGGMLQRVVIDWAMELRDARSYDDLVAIRGKMAGMFVELEAWLDFAVKHTTTEELQAATEDAIRATLQDAAEGGPEKRFQARLKAKKSAAARKAAAARWDKHRESSAANNI